MNNYLQAMKPPWQPPALLRVPMHMSISFSQLNSSATPPPLFPQTNVPWAWKKKINFLNNIHSVHVAFIVYICYSYINVIEVNKLFFPVTYITSITGELVIEYSNLKWGTVEQD